MRGNASVVRDGAGGAKEFIGVDAVAGEGNDADAVTPAGASDPVRGW